MLENRWLKRVFPGSENYLDPITYQRYSLVSSLLFISSTTLLFFIFYHTFISLHYIEALVSLVGALIGYSLLWYLRQTLKIQQFAFYAMLAFGLFLLIFNTFNQNSGFGMMWSLFFPVYTLMAVGRRIGLRAVVIFYLLVLAQGVYGLSIWPDPQWDLTGLVRFSIGYFLLVYIISAFELASDLRNRQTSADYERERLHVEQLKVLSITDPLTGLFNRRHFMEISHKLVARMRAEKTELIMFILDVDDFKLYNDTYGHQQGDRALETIANVVKSYSCHGDCTMFRLGGEEFAGLILAKDASKVLDSLEHLRQSVQLKNIEHTKSRLGLLSVSMGVKIVHPEDEFAIDDIYKMADIALYQAKASGRNQIVLHQD